MELTSVGPATIAGFLNDEAVHNDIEALVCNSFVLARVEGDGSVEEGEDHEGEGTAICKPSTVSFSTFIMLMHIEEGQWICDKVPFFRGGSRGRATLYRHWALVTTPCPPEGRGISAKANRWLRLSMLSSPLVLRSWLSKRRSRHESFDGLPYMASQSPDSKVRAGGKMTSRRRSNWIMYAVDLAIVNGVHASQTRYILLRWQNACCERLGIERRLRCDPRTWQSVLFAPWGTTGAPDAMFGVRYWWEVICMPAVEMFHSHQ